MIKMGNVQPSDEPEMPGLIAILASCYAFAKLFADFLYSPHCLPIDS